MEDTSLRFYNEMRRYFYTTPSSYLDLLKLYNKMFDGKKLQINTKKSRIGNGLKVKYITLRFKLPEGERINNILETIRNEYHDRRYETNVERPTTSIG